MIIRQSRNIRECNKKANEKNLSFFCSSVSPAWDVRVLDKASCIILYHITLFEDYDMMWHGAIWLLLRYDINLYTIEVYDILLPYHIKWFYIILYHVMLMLMVYDFMLCYVMFCYVCVMCGVVMLLYAMWHDFNLCPQIYKVFL